MPDAMLFTDASLDPRSRVGFGACLVVSEPDLSLPCLKARILLKRFDHTSSTRLELQVLVWALSDPGLPAGEGVLTIYTDSQNIIGLPARRERLEKNDYSSGASKPLKNSALYQQFFSLIDQLNCQLIQVAGHQPASAKNAIDQLFTLVDRASRTALRNYTRGSDCVHRQ